MTHKKKSPTRKQGLSVFRLSGYQGKVPSDPCLHSWCLYGILMLRINNMDTSLAQNPNHIAKRQPDALKVMPLILWQNIKKAKSMFDQRVDNGPTPDRHDQHVNAREQTSTSLYWQCWESGGTMGEINYDLCSKRNCV